MQARKDGEADDMNGSNDREALPEAVPETLAVSEESVEYELKNLGPQVHTVNTHRCVFGHDASGRLFAYSAMVGIPAILLVIDVAEEKLVARIPIEADMGGTVRECTIVRGLAAQPDGTVYIAGTPSHLFKYVPGNRHVDYVGKVPGQQVFDMKSGPQGVLIGGTYSKSEAFEFYTANGDTVCLGSVLPGESYAYSVAYDRDRNDAYFGIGAHAHLVKYDRDTKRMTEIALPERFQGNPFVFDLTAAGGKLFIRLSSGTTIAMDLDTQLFDETEGSVTSRFMSPESPSGERIYYTCDSRLGYYDMNSREYVVLDVQTGGNANGFTFSRLTDPAYPGDTLIGVTREGRLFKYNPSTGHSKVVNLEVAGVPTELQTVKATSGGHVYTSGYLSGGIALHDPEAGMTKEFTNETMGDGQQLPGSQTDRIYEFNKKLYFVNYTGMNVYEYDPSIPWDRLDSASPNPRLLFTASDIGYQDRGLAGMMLQDGRLVIGTVPKYGHLGGALVIYDLTSDRREVYWNIVEQQSVTAVAYKNGLIYGGSCVWGGLGVHPSAEEAKLFIWDAAAKQKIFEITPVPGTRAITELIEGPDGNLWGSAEGWLFIFDPAARQVVYTKQLMPRRYSSTVWRDTQFAVGTDGNVYGVQANLFFVIDAKTKEMKVIRSGGKRNWLSRDRFGHFYLTEGADLLRISIPGLVRKPDESAR
ncbi:hypothetical protein [Paenibacillus sp. H1-7]|uniref:hypothetical protein n=1 Tax=Paenibacillus sp. H1-7 TaxID=2282849 RepID=UPI001EF82A65|nr:hypothetical protein [Paenibacillus sp. H1-7]